LLTQWRSDQKLDLCFKNAKFLVSADGWQRASHPHARDRASFIPELNELLLESGRLEIVHGHDSEHLGKGYRFHYSEGHTPGLMLTEMMTSNGPIVFAGDLIPGAAWVHLPITMGYDRFPEKLIDEKAALLQDLYQRGGSLFFTHDPEVAVGRVVRDEKGRFSVGDTRLDEEFQCLEC